MTAVALDDLLKRVWPRVRSKHLYPELPVPSIAEGEERVGLDMRGRRITLSREFVQGLSQTLEEEEIVEGLLDHAVSHYLCCPWNLSTHLKLYGEAKKVLKDKDMAKKATDAFMDVVADTHCVSQKETPLPVIYRHIKRGTLDEALHALYERIWGMDLGAGGHEEISRKLSRLPYLDRTRWGESIRRFAKAVQPILEGEGRSGELARPSPMGGHRLQQYSREEIEQGLKDLASDSATPSEFAEIVKDFEEELREAFRRPHGTGPRPSAGRRHSLLYETCRKVDAPCPQSSDKEKRVPLPPSP